VQRLGVGVAALLRVKLRQIVQRYSESVSQRGANSKNRLSTLAYPRCAWCLCLSVPNGGYRKPVEAAIMKGLGVVAGVPDVIVIHAGRCYALEIKAPGGRATPKQLAAIAAMEAAGAYTCIAENLDRALSKCLSAGESCGGERHEQAAP
jgi:hypothetical protein